MNRLAFSVALLGLTAAIVIAGVLLWNAALGNTGGPTWTAEFTDARGLVAGNDVRTGGAVVGRVSDISLSRAGTALVHFTISDRRASPRADAAAAIRPSDLLGDNYLSLSPGTAKAPLRGSITTANTVNAPRLDQVLDAFQPNVRDGLRALLVEGGIALDERGGSLARAIVDLRPTLDAAGGVLNELADQNVALARMLPAAASAAGQLDAQRGDLGPLLDGLARTLSATAGSATALDHTLLGLPSTLSRLRATASGLSTLAVTATPVARTVGAVAAPLNDALRGLPDLLERVRTGMPGLTGAVDAARTALVTGGPGLEQLGRAMPVLHTQAPAISALLGKLDQSAPGIAQGFFVDFPGQAAEPGDQPFDPFADPTRNYWRGAAVLTCQTFGVPVAPGCLTQAIADLSAATPHSLLRAAAAPATTHQGKTASAAPSPATPTPIRTPSTPSTPSTSPSAAPATPAAPTTAPAPVNPPPDPLSKLLSFLLGP